MRKCKVQHGDVLIMEDDQVEENYKKIELKENYIVERGEGVHTHVLTKVKNCTAFKNEFGDLKLQIQNLPEALPALDHEEHGRLTLMPGIVKKEIERDMDAENEEERNVID